MAIDSILRKSAEKYQDKAVIHYGERTITYRNLDKQVDSLAAALLQMGLGHHERVGVILGNCPEFVLSYFAITRAGATIVPFNPLLKGEEIKFIINDANIVILIIDKAFANTIESLLGTLESIRQVIVVGGETAGHFIAFEDLIGNDAKPLESQVTDDDIAACLYTSGTSGKPKGALLSHGNLTFDVAATMKRVDYEPEDIHLCALPLFHSFCQNASMLCPIYTGGTIVIISQFIPDIVLKTIADRSVTSFCGVPAMFNALLTVLKARKQRSLPSVRLCISGGAPMPMEILSDYENEYGIIIREGNGPTETSPVSYVNPPGKCKYGSVGPPLEGVMVKIVDDNDNEVPIGQIGEICIKGPNVMKGYLNKPEETAEVMKDGWFHTGDLGRVDEDNYVFIVDRKKDIIITGGLNVYPREIEECLYQHPGVQEAAVIGSQDKVHGEIPLAYIVAKPMAELTAKEIILFCRKHLANYKCPRQVVFAEALPKLGTGKIDKKQLAEAHSMGLMGKSE